MPRQTYFGLCTLCGERLSKQGAARHLKTCRVAHPPKGKATLQPGFYLRVEGRGAPMYWLDVEVPAKATFRDLDQFLRGIWLECCGHLSAFAVGQTRYEDGEGDDAALDDYFAALGLPALGSSSRIRTKPMQTRLAAALEPGLKFAHEYDFGSTTELTLKVLAHYDAPFVGKAVRLLVQNEPPIWVCAKCGTAPATQICVECAWGGQGFFCQKCAAKHKKHEDMFLPVVNSPRMGVCGYRG